MLLLVQSPKVQNVLPLFDKQRIVDHFIMSHLNLTATLSKKRFLFVLDKPLTDVQSWGGHIWVCVRTKINQLNWLGLIVAALATRKAIHVPFTTVRPKKYSSLMPSRPATWLKTSRPVDLSWTEEEVNKETDRVSQQALTPRQGAKQGTIGGVLSRASFH